MVGARTRAAVGCALAVLAAGCSTGSDDAGPATGSPTPSSTSSTSGPTTASPSPTPSPTPPPSPSVPDRLVVPPAAAALPATWRERFVIGYGRGRALLGTSPGGDSGTLDIGPEYGAPGPDGSWWFLDAAKARLAHYDANGAFLDAVRIPRPMLVAGRYFQWQLPHVLADGSLVAVRQDPPGAQLLRLRAGVLDEIPLPHLFAPTYDDGALLYGFAGGRPVVVDPVDGSMRPAARFRTPSGARFSVVDEFDGGRLRVELPESGVVATLPLRTASGARAHVGVQVRAGADDSLHLLLVGAGDDDESVQLVGFTSVTPSGAVSPVEPLTNPFSEADPGSPAQLTMAPGSSSPMLVYVLDDGVHVYERAA